MLEQKKPNSYVKKINIIFKNLYFACPIIFFVYKMETAEVACSNSPYNTSIYASRRHSLYC